ncbi:XRE family transcriptional regulator [Psychrilyobacter sp.]|uniref:XRE family transcriptional regulator n=1 Tax=Psychrilyobacter sp. TaxID=2586924 RepID=UPI003016542C
MNEIGSIIKKWRYKNNLTGAQLAQKIEVSQQFLNGIENGKKKLSKKVFEKIVLVVDVETKNELEYAFYVNELPSNLKRKLEGKIKIGNIDLNNPITEFKQIPIYDSISAGFGSRKSGIIGHMPLPQTNGFRGDVIAIRVDGDSMQPDIKDGDTVLIKKGVMPENGEVGAFILNDEGLLKRYKKTDRGDIILSSDNKDYDPIIINEYDEFYIVGKKVGVFNH